MSVAPEAVPPGAERVTELAESECESGGTLCWVCDVEEDEVRVVNVRVEPPPPATYDKKTP